MTQLWRRHREEEKKRPHVEEWQAERLTGEKHRMYATRQREAEWISWKNASWEVKEIKAARKAPECIGGWEYWIEWKGEQWAGYGKYEHSGAPEATGPRTAQPEGVT
jgi:hypothetical protein